MREVRFYLHISAEEFLRYYRGTAGSVVVSAEDGSRLRFPAASLRKFITREGISGRFVIRFDEKNKLLGIERLA